MLSLRIAIRYLLAKKSHNAINAITLVASCGVAIITAAMICMLSVFNGFESLVDRLCSNFDPEIRIEPKVGKTFSDSDSIRNVLLGYDGIEQISLVLEEDIMLSYGTHQLPAKLIGVDENYCKVTNIDSLIAAGEFLLKDEAADYCVLGAGLATQLGAGSAFVRPISAYCPIRSGNINLLNPEEAFTEGLMYCSGIFLVNQADYDDNICIVSLDFARTLLQDNTATSAYELKLSKSAKATDIKDKLSKFDIFSVLTQREQQADSYRIMQIEKWITFLIVVFILLIASFNIIGALSMLIIDKEEEILTLRNLGADNKMIRSIFAFEGLLISGCGAIIGIIIGVILCYLQENYGIISLGGNSDAYIVDAYPVVLQWTDVFYTIISVFIIGALASIYPLSVIKKQS